MKQIIANFHKGLAAGIIIASVSLFGVLGCLGGLFDFVEYKLYDIRVRIFAPYSRPSDDIVVILLDQDSIDWGSRERGWSWPWPREAYAELADYLNLGGAASLAFDVLFSEPSVYGSDDDLAFAEASSRFGRVVQTVFFSSQRGSDFSWPDIDKPLLRPENFGSLQDSYDLKMQRGESRAQFPIPQLRDSAGVIGNVTGTSDSDDVFRRSDLFALFDGRSVPALSTASLLANGHTQTLTYGSGAKAVQWGNFTIPVDRDGRCILRFRGTLEAYHPYYAYQVLQSARDVQEGNEPLIYPEDFSGRYVFFGFYAAGLFDICTTPIQSVYPGVGMHITMLDNILQQDFIRQSSLALDLSVMLLPIILVVLLVLFSHHIRLTVPGTILIFMLLIGFCTGAYQVAGTWVPLAAPLFCTVLAFLASTIYTYSTEGSQKRFIKDAFSRYLAPSVIEQIIADPSKLNLGGEKRQMSAIFTDIQRFSSISEALQNQYADEGPKVLVQLLNLYLTEMSSIILKNGGTVDKYEGDAIIAFFGAPIWTPDHAALACKSAIQMKKREAELAGEIMAPENSFSLPLSKLVGQGILRAERPLYTRLGINTGDMVVGNMGTPNKMNYTIMGNAVNLSARLEGVNKQYNTGGILISEYTKNEIGDEFVVRSLSRVRVVGINTPLRLYELLEIKDSAAREMLEMIELWEEGFKLYEAKEFSGAKRIFSLVYEADKTDGAARRYMERCRSYLGGEPLPEDFPIDNLTEK